MTAPGSFVLTGSSFEGSECEGWFGLDLFPDHREGLAWEAAIEDSQEPVADQGEIGQERSVSAPRPVLPHQRIPPPMVAVFDSGPMTPDQLMPLFGCQFLRFETADVVADLLGGLAGALLGPATPDNHHTAGIRKVHRHGVGAKGVEGAAIDATVTYLAFLKKGVPGVAAFCWASFSRWGWLPLICRT